MILVIYLRTCGKNTINSRKAEGGKINELKLKTYKTKIKYYQQRKMLVLGRTNKIDKHLARQQV